MEEKLRSISKQIRWSSAVKAAVFALAWLWLPSWAFVVIALGIYFIPFFRPRKLFVPFATLLVLAFYQEPGALFAVVFGAVFYAILLIKDLLLIDRRSAYELVTLTLTFLVLRAFYLHFNEGITGNAVFAAFVLAVVIALLVRGLTATLDEGMVIQVHSARIAAWLSALTLSEVMIMGLFLPLDFIYQSVIVFLVAMIIVDLLPQYLTANLTRTKVLTAATVIFALLVIVVSSARWGL